MKGGTKNMEEIAFTDNLSVLKSDIQYSNITIDVARALKSWRDSVFSFEWLTSDGCIKPLHDLPDNEKAKRQDVETQIKQGESLQKPILGIGIQDNVEIGSGKAVFLTLAARGVKVMPVHIPKSNEKDFKNFLADLN